MLNKRKILITGGNGMFAWDMRHVLGNNKLLEPMSLDRSQLDITDKIAVAECIGTIKPFAVINTVGPLVDPCENDLAMATRVNVDAVKYLAAACRKINARFVHLSTCGLFGNERKFYTEEDPVVLKTVYARTKYEGEKVALENCEDTLIVRPGWMYGGAAQMKKNFVAARLREAQSKKIIQSARDKFGSPTWTRNVAEAVYQLLFIDDLRGVFHLSNSGGGSRADYVGQIVRNAGLATKVEAVDSSVFPRKSAVPDCEMLDNSRLNSLLNKPMPNWQEALAKYIREELKL